MPKDLFTGPSPDPGPTPTKPNTGHRERGGGRPLKDGVRPTREPKQNHKGGRAGCGVCWHDANEAN